MRCTLHFVALFCSVTLSTGALAQPASEPSDEGPYTLEELLQQAKVDMAETELATLRHALDLFYVLHGHYPTRLDELAQDVEGMGPVLERLPQDPWDQPYQYQAEGDAVVLFSGGPDGAPGTDDDVYADDDGPSQSDPE